MTDWQELDFDWETEGEAALAKAAAELTGESQAIPAPQNAPGVRVAAQGKVCQICLERFTDPKDMNLKDIYCKRHKNSIEQCRRLAKKQDLLAEFDALYKAKPKTDEIRQRFAAAILKYEMDCPPQPNRGARNEDLRLTEILVTTTHKLTMAVCDTHRLLTSSAWMEYATKAKGGGYTTEGAKAKWLEHLAEEGFKRDHLGVEFGRSGALRLEMPHHAEMTRSAEREHAVVLKQSTAKIKGKKAEQLTSAEGIASLSDTLVGFGGVAFTGMASSSSSVADVGGDGTLVRPSKVFEARPPKERPAETLATFPALPPAS